MKIYTGWRLHERALDYQLAECNRGKIIESYFEPKWDWIRSAVEEYIDAEFDYSRVRKEEGYEDRMYRCGSNRKMDNAIERCNKYEEALQAVCRALDIPYRALITATRVAREYESRMNWERCFPNDQFGKLVVILTEFDEVGKTVGCKK